MVHFMCLNLLLWGKKYGESIHWQSIHVAFLILLNVSETLCILIIFFYNNNPFWRRLTSPKQKHNSMKLISFETTTGSNWKCVSKSLGREEGKPEHWELYGYTTYWQHLGLCQRSRLILCAWKLDWKGMQMLFLICIILSSSHDADIVISLSWCIKANKAERELWGILVNVNPRILLVYFAVAAFLKSFLKSAQSRKKREMKTLKSQSHKMIDSCVVWNFLIWCWGTGHWSQTSPPTHNMFHKCFAGHGHLK